MKGDRLQRIGFVGYECEDIVLYLASHLTDCGKKVAIEDKSEAGMLMRMVDTNPQSTKQEGQRLIPYRGICVTNALQGKEEYDVVFLVFGYRIQHPKLYECETLVLVTDGLPAHAMVLREVEQWERKQGLLIRNYTEARHGAGYLELLTGQKAEQIFLLPWDERDLRGRYSLGQEERMNLCSLSGGMKEVIREMTAFIAPELPKEMIKKIGRR